MDAWLPTAKPPQTNYSFRRNPYFWAVDSAGRQLPYLDEIMLLAVAADAMNAKIIAGEPNFQIYGDIGALTEYKQAQKEQGYEIIEWTRLEVSDASIQLNLNTADPVLQKIFRDKNFRIALSYAIDRDAINKTLYFGLMEPVQATLNKIDGDVFNKEYYKAFTEYKPDESNRLLDAMGLTKRDSDGYRMRPDGKRLTIVAEFQNWATAIANQFRMIREDYKKIGIDFIPKPLESSIFQQRAATDQTEATGFPFGKTKTDTGLVPINTGVRYAPLWGLWYATKGVNGIKPDDPLQLTLMDTWTNILQETDVAKRSAMYDTILKAQAENLWIIATVGPTKTLVLRKPWFRNVPKNYYVSWHHGRNYAASYPMQYWIEKAHQND
jgi:peptide/nickel transport system substrate-binding protein